MDPESLQERKSVDLPSLAACMQRVRTLINIYMGSGYRAEDGYFIF